MTWLAVCLAVLDACCFAAGARLQHHGSPGSASLISAVRRPRWLAGLALLAVGATLYVIALRLAPLTVVQPFGVLTVVVSVMWGLRDRGARLRLGTGLALAAILTGAGSFAVLAARATVPAPVTSRAEAQAGLLVFLTVAACAAVGRLLRGRGRCLFLATGGGVAYGYAPMLVRAATEQYADQGVHGALLGTLAALAMTVLVGCWSVQQAYAAGPPEITVACLTVADPLVAVAIGIGLLGEAPGITRWTAVAGLACAALAVSGIVRLSLCTSLSASAPLFLPRQEHVMSGTLRQRIVIGADTYPPDINGAANFAHRLATGLAGRGHEVHVICPSPGTGPERTTVDGVVVHRLVSHRTPFHPTFRVCLPWQITRPATGLLDRLAPDAVHVQSHFAVGRTLAAAARRRAIPVVATNHFMPENLIGYARISGRLGSTACRLAWRDLVRVFHRAQIVTAPTPRAVRLLHEHGLGTTALPVSCGLDLHRFAQPAVSSKNGEHRVLFVGRLDAEKNVHELLRALPLLPDELRVTAEIVGDGSCRGSLEALARELDIYDRVMFHGLVNDQEVLDAYARCDVFCMPGTAELQSLATMEAMAAGKPVVAADAMALPHLVRPGRNGHLYPPGDTRALASALTAVLSDRDVRMRMGEASREIIAHHDIGYTLDTFETLYLEAAGRRPAGNDRLLANPFGDSGQHEYAARSGR
jgi:glycosyltransferase involved in cell wall biosynthesis